MGPTYQKKVKRKGDVALQPLQKNKKENRICKDSIYQQKKKTPRTMAYLDLGRNQGPQSTKADEEEEEEPLIERSGEDPSEEFVAKSGRRRKLGDEMVAVIKGSDRA